MTPTMVAHGVSDRSDRYSRRRAKHTMGSLDTSCGTEWFAGDGNCTAANVGTSADTTPTRTAGGPDPRRTGSNYSTSPRSQRPDTHTDAQRSPAPGSPTTLDGRCRGEPVAWQHARRFGERLGKRTDGNIGTAPQADSNRADAHPAAEREDDLCVTHQYRAQNLSRDRCVTDHGIR
jgi:hypothetical protein